MKDNALHQAANASIDFKRLFDAVPGLLVVLLPDEPSFTVVAVSDAHLQATGIARDYILGRSFFEIFPGGPDPHRAAAIQNLRASFRCVISTRQPNLLPVQRYDMPRPGSEGSEMQERYWSPMNSPVLGADDTVEYIIHRVEDVTEFIQLKRMGAEPGQIAEAERGRADRMEAELFLRSRQLSEQQAVIRERDQLLAELRAAAARQSLMLQLEETLREVAADPEAIMATSTEWLARHLGVARVGYVAVDEGVEYPTGGCSYTDPARLLGVLERAERLEDYGTLPMEDILAGRIARVNDLAGNSSTESGAGSKAAAGARATLAVPIQRHGRTVAFLFIHDDRPHHWTETEADLAREIAGRTWAAVERARAEQALRESEQRLSRALEAGELGVWELDLVTRAAWRSLKHDQIFGYAELLPEWTYEMFLNHIVAEDRAEVDRKFQEALAAGSAWTFECRIRRADGVVSWIWAQGRLEKDARGDLRRIKGMVHDITERKRAEEELRRTNRELEEFAYVSSHDLQEPLRMVNIYTQILLRDLEPHFNENIRRHAGIIQKNVKRMEQLLQDLLQFSSTVNEGNALQERDATANLGNALSQAISALDNRIAEEGAVVTTEPLPTVEGDESQLTQVFQNLIANALKYRKAEEPPVVNITARQHGSEWIISVSDNGIGFEREHTERIFGLFKRLHKDQYPGTGLGLAICKRIVERYRGRIWAESSPGQGSTFSFALPQPAAHPAED